jgi:hypothetical protein
MLDCMFLYQLLYNDVCSFLYTTPSFSFVFEERCKKKKMENDFRPLFSFSVIFVMFFCHILLEMCCLIYFIYYDEYYFYNKMLVFLGGKWLQVLLPKLLILLFLPVSFD